MISSLFTSGTFVYLGVPFSNNTDLSLNDYKRKEQTEKTEKHK